MATVRAGERPTAQRLAAKGSPASELRLWAEDFAMASGKSSESEKSAAVRRDLKACDVRRRYERRMDRWRGRFTSVGERKRATKAPERASMCWVRGDSTRAVRCDRVGVRDGKEEGKVSMKDWGSAVTSDCAVVVSRRPSRCPGVKSKNANSFRSSLYSGPGAGDSPVEDRCE